MAKDEKAFGNFLREMIKQTGILQSAFYSAVEITKPYFYDILSVKVNPPPPDRHSIICPIAHSYCVRLIHFSVCKHIIIAGILPLLRNNAHTFRSFPKSAESKSSSYARIKYGI